MKMIDTSKLRKIEDCKGKLKEVISNEEIIQLAKSGICPHYILTNPLTKQESIWFVSSEINEWFQSNYVSYREGCFEQNLNFMYFDKIKHRPTSEIPEELSRIVNLFQLPIENISTPSGIYFLCKGKTIQYIGQSYNIAGRVITHKNEGLKDFDKIYFITCAISKLTELESSLIRYYNPPLNRTIGDRCKPRESDILTIESLCTTTE